MVVGTFGAAPRAGAEPPAEGLPAAELFGLNKSPRLNLPGEGDGAGCAAGTGAPFAFVVVRCFAGVCDGEGDSAGLGDCAMQGLASAKRTMKAKIWLFITVSVGKLRYQSQSNSDLRWRGARL